MLVFPLISNLYFARRYVFLTACLMPFAHGQTGGHLQIVSSATYQPGPVSPDSVAAGSDLSLLTARCDPGETLAYSLGGDSV